MVCADGNSLGCFDVLLDKYRQRTAQVRRDTLLCFFVVEKAGAGLICIVLERIAAGYLAVIVHSDEVVKPYRNLLTFR